MNVLTTVTSNFAAITADSPLFVGALALTFVGIGAIAASCVMAIRQNNAHK